MDTTNITEKDESSINDTNGYKQQGKILFSKYITMYIYMYFELLL